MLYLIHQTMDFIQIASQCLRAPINSICANDRFVAFFGVYPNVCEEVSKLIASQPLLSSCYPCHLLWALYFLKCYPTERTAAIVLHVDEKTYRKWIWYVLDRLSEIDNVSKPHSPFHIISFDLSLTLPRFIGLIVRVRYFLKIAVMHQLTELTLLFKNHNHSTASGFHTKSMLQRFVTR